MTTKPTTRESGGPKLGAGGHREHRDLVSRVRSLWQREQSPDAVAFLAKHSSVRQNRPLAIELAYEEYCIRRDAGEQIRPSSYCHRFPSISRSLFRQIEVDEYARLNPSIVGRQSEIKWPHHGEQLLGFVVVEEIGRGAFARAYLCAQPGIGNRQVVVKVSRGGSLEANTMGGLDHPNIMSVYSVQEDPATRLTGICMPFVGRSTLFDVVDVAFGRDALPTRSAVILEACRALTSRGDRYHRATPHVKIRGRSAYVTGVLQLVVQLADALTHAHHRGVLHGDLKPSNVVMSVTGIPMLVDFNLSQTRDSASFVTGGTLPYMAPEQIRMLLLGPDAEDRVDERADVFALGAIMYELLVGRTPFGAEIDEAEPFALAGRMLDAQSLSLQSIRKLNPLVDAGFADLVRRCLAFEASGRPESMQQVARELRRYLSMTYRARRFSRRNRSKFLAAGCVGAGAMLAAAGWLASRPSLSVRSFRRGVEAYHQENYFDAMQEFNQSIAADDEFANSYLARGCTALQQFETDQFDARLDSAFHDFTLAGRFANHPQIDAARAYCSIKKRDFKAAIASLRSLLDSGFESVDIWNNLGYCYEKSRVEVLSDRVRLNEVALDAETAFRRAIELNPNVATPHFNLARMILMRCQNSDQRYDPREGLAHARLSLELNADDAASFVFAAKLAALTAETDDDPALRDECVDYLEGAIERGHTISNLRPFDAVAEHPKFLQLIDRPPADRRPTRITPTIAPAVMNSQFELDNGTDSTVTR